MNFEQLMEIDLLQIEGLYNYMTEVSHHTMYSLSCSYGSYTQTAMVNSVWPHTI